MAEAKSRPPLVRKQFFINAVTGPDEEGKRATIRWFIEQRGQIGIRNVSTEVGAAMMRRDGQNTIHIHRSPNDQRTVAAVEGDLTLYNDGTLDELHRKLAALFPV